MELNVCKMTAVVWERLWEEYTMVSGLSRPPKGKVTETSDHWTDLESHSRLIFIILICESLVGRSVLGWDIEGVTVE